MPVDVQPLAEQLRELAVQANLDPGHKVAALLEAAWSLALGLGTNRSTNQ